MSKTVIIGAGEKLWESLESADFSAVLDWFRANGVNPEEVPHDRAVAIADGWIDYWSLGDDRPEGSKLLTTTWLGGERKIAHVQTPVLTPMPNDLAGKLAGKLRDLWMARVERGAQAAAAFAAAEYRAKAEA